MVVLGVSASLVFGLATVVLPWLQAKSPPFVPQSDTGNAVVFVLLSLLGLFVRYVPQRIIHATDTRMVWAELLIYAVYSVLLVLCVDWCIRQRRPIRHQGKAAPSDQ